MGEYIFGGDEQMNTQIIVDRMNELGLTYRSLAVKAGVSAKVLQNALEEHDVIMFFDTMKIAHFLGLSLDALLTDSKADAGRNLSDLIMRYCKMRDWELPDFAEVAGLNTGNLRAIVSGSQRAGNSEAVRIAQTVGITVDELARVCTGEVSVDDVVKQEAGNE